MFFFFYLNFRDVVFWFWEKLVNFGIWNLCAHFSAVTWTLWKSPYARTEPTKYPNFGKRRRNSNLRLLQHPGVPFSGRPGAPGVTRLHQHQPRIRSLAFSCGRSNFCSPASWQTQFFGWPLQINQLWDCFFFSRYLRLSKADQSANKWTLEKHSGWECDEGKYNMTSRQAWFSQNIWGLLNLQNLLCCADLKMAQFHPSIRRSSQKNGQQQHHSNAAVWQTSCAASEHAVPSQA